MITTGKQHCRHLVCPLDFVCQQMLRVSYQYVDHSSSYSYTDPDPNVQQLPSWVPVATNDDNGDRLMPPASEPELEVMTAIYNLANTVIANQASRTLAK